jgi:hypothetical protein
MTSAYPNVKTSVARVGGNLDAGMKKPFFALDPSNEVQLRL